MQRCPSYFQLSKNDSRNAKLIGPLGGAYHRRVHPTRPVPTGVCLLAKNSQMTTGRVSRSDLQHGKVVVRGGWVEGGETTHRGVMKSQISCSGSTEI